MLSQTKDSYANTFWQIFAGFLFTIHCLPHNVEYVLFHTQLLNL